MRCLIVAAGQGTRLRDKGESKPLIHLRGLPLIEHVIARARLAGIEEFFVVTGYRGKELRAALEDLARREAIRITPVINEDWDRANGMSVYKAKAALGDQPFILTMCDHIVDPEILRVMMQAPIEPGTVTLGVDYNLDSPLNDPDDVTRVLCDGTQILRIGKVLREFNAHDTGVFLCTSAMFDALEASQANGDDSISGAMTVLAGWGKARACDIGDRVWVDVDDPAAFQKAEQLLDAGRL
jgi:1L-myo-inositol 1-phosphate cytidylyltransferase